MQGIPPVIKLFNFAKKGLRFSGSYRIKDFPRIAALASNVEDNLTAELHFDIKEDKIPCIEGHIKADITLICQRCLEDVKIQINPSFKLAYLQNEEQGLGLDSSYEIVENSEKEFSTIEFLTDEMLLSIPMIPMHPHQCSSFKDQQELKQQERENPFAILKNIKKSKE